MVGRAFSHELIEKRLRARFYALDATNSEGRIDMAEFGKLLLALGDARPPADVEAELTKINVDDTGHITYFEFVKWWCKR